jgi:hypothetical protein
MHMQLFPLADGSGRFLLTVWSVTGDDDTNAAPYFIHLNIICQLESLNRIFLFRYFLCHLGVQNTWS